MQSEPATSQSSLWNLNESVDGVIVLSEGIQLTYSVTVQNLIA